MKAPEDYIWSRLRKPFFVLAPMDDVTDSVFRRVVARAGKPDLMFTEFVNVEGLTSAGRPRLLPKLYHAGSERPLIAQIWGKDPDKFRVIASELADMHFDGVDINMACPDKAVVKSGCGAALIENIPLAGEIIAAVRDGAAGRLPVSVKTRLGLKRQKTEEWIGFLLAQKLDAITIHARTASEMSRVPARWEEIGKAVRLRDRMKNNTLIIGNGDVQSVGEGKKKAAVTGCDGVMIGRGIFANPWLFTGNPVSRYSLQDRLDLLKHHLTLFDETWGANKNYHILKKYFKIYIQGFPGASMLRTNLMNTTTLAEAGAVIRVYGNS